MKSGVKVEVTRDDGSKFITKTRSESWELGHGQEVILLEGIRGGYSMDRVKEVATSIRTRANETTEKGLDSH